MPKPSAYMRSRRPEQFFETEEEPPVALDKAFFEYKLETLTSRSEEKQFEHFAWKLAERLICPNLIPQTGPTGGGVVELEAARIASTSATECRTIGGI